MFVRLHAGLASHAACARRVVGMFAFDYVRACYARSLRSKDSWYVCVRLRVGLATLAACARRVVDMCAADIVGIQNNWVRFFYVGISVVYVWCITSVVYH